MPRYTVGLTLYVLLLFAASPHVAEAPAPEAGRQYYATLDSLQDTADRIAHAKATLEASLRQWPQAQEEDMLPLPGLECGLSPEAARAVADAEAEYSLPAGMLLAVIRQESGCREDAINTNSNGTQDHGLAQLNDGTWPWLAEMTGASDPYDARDNARMAAWYLAYLLDRHTDADAVLTAYNRGEAGLRAYVASRGTARSEYSKGVIAAWAGGD